MSMTRYTFSKRTHKGKVIEPSKASTRIYRGVQSGAIQVSHRVLEEGERLDQIAGVVYGDGGLWWLIAAASGIGWAIQVPPGTLLKIPVNPSEAFSLLL
jgi:nucleoid-associated protein YgaU